MTKRFDNDTLLARWLSAELSDEERQALERHPDFPAFQRLVAATDRLALPGADIQAMWDKFSQNIEKQDKNKPLARRFMMWWMLAAAASAALLIFAWLFLPSAEEPWTVVDCGIGEHKTINLPDGSTVRLNAGSSLGILRKNWSRKRRLRLEGEAFFEVRKNAAAPFEVESGNGSVRVLGTTFSVKTRSQVFEVACFSGSVRAVSKDAYEQTLQMGQKAAAQHGVQDWSPVQPLTENKPAWVDGQSRFEDAPVEEVFEEVERQYNVNVTFSGLQKRRFSGAFPHNNLDIALKIICGALDANYAIQNHQVSIQAK